MKSQKGRCVSVCLKMKCTSCKRRILDLNTFVREVGLLTSPAPVTVQRVAEGDSRTMPGKSMSCGASKPCQGIYKVHTSESTQLTHPIDSVLCIVYMFTYVLEVFRVLHGS